LSDLGDIVIKERPLIIREAIVGGRKLTKALYRQLPETENILFRDVDHIVAWINYHWTDCGSHSSSYSSIHHTHKHVLCDKAGSPIRGAAFMPISARASVEIGCHDDNGGNELTALVVRLRLENKEIGAGYGGRYTLNRGSQAIIFQAHGKVQEALSAGYYLQSAKDEPPKALVALALPAVPEDELTAKVDEAIAEELEYRVQLAEVWRLVTEETPQVFI
jgi:hypothetical protein